MAEINERIECTPENILIMDKRKRTNLTINQKLEIIQKLESGISVSRICEQYGIKKQTVSDIKKNKDKLNKFISMCDIGANSRKRMKLAHETSLEEGILKWYQQQRSNGVTVRAVDLRNTAIKLANHLNIPFKASDGWLWRFRNRHGLLNKKIKGEASRASEAEAKSKAEKKESEITDSINLSVDESEDIKEEDESEDMNYELSLISSHLDDLITFIDYSSDNEVKLYYRHFCNFRELITKKQQNFILNSNATQQVFEDK